MWRAVAPAEWPEAPTHLSFSGLLSIEACPRRWSLGSATYSGVWDRPGYPSRPGPSALEGRIVHKALEVITAALSRGGVSSTGDPAAISTLRGLGGYSRILQDAIANVMGAEDDNLRVDEQRESWTRSFRTKLASLREKTQSLLARVELQPRDQTDESLGTPNAKGPLPAGSYSEVRLASAELEWRGIVDLLTLSEEGCEIVDFKTGEAKPEHTKQLEIYSLLWLRDSERNPLSRPVVRLTISYPSAAVDVAPLTDDGYDALELELRKRSADARKAVSSSPPEAKPGWANCQFCDVRQICDAYWQSGTQSRLAEEAGEQKLTDVEVTITARHGPTSWDAVVETSRTFESGGSLLIRTAPAEVNLQVGDRIRFLGGYLGEPGEDDDTPVVTSCSATEIFFV